MTYVAKERDAERPGARSPVEFTDLDYVRFYDLERHLFEEVAARFYREGSLGAFDVFSIVLWKANRAKKHMAARLMKQGHDSLEAACRTLTAAVHNAPDERSRFMVPVRDWGFRVPMASALLAVLYPDEFTVYDYRACDVLEGFHDLNNKVKPEAMWEGYILFRDAVKKAGPDRLGLRDKDRYLWGRAVADQLTSDIKESFGIGAG